MNVSARRKVKKTSKRHHFRNGIAQSDQKNKNWICLHAKNNIKVSAAVARLSEARSNHRCALQLSADERAPTKWKRKEKRGQGKSIAAFRRRKWPDLRSFNSTLGRIFENLVHKLSSIAHHRLCDSLLWAVVFPPLYSSAVAAAYSYICGRWEVSCSAKQIREKHLIHFIIIIDVNRCE